MKDLVMGFATNIKAERIEVFDCFQNPKILPFEQDQDHHGENIHSQRHRAAPVTTISGPVSAALRV
jgi:hypothetical protein